MNRNSLSIIGNCYCIVISINGDTPVKSPIITANHPLGIDKSGLCTSNKADALLSLNSDNELVITKTEHAEVMITRSGRKYYLKPDKPIIIFRNDRITIDNSCIEIISKAHINRQHESALLDKKATYSSSTRTYLRILSTIAAIFTLCAVHSNAYGQAPDNNTLQDLRCTEPSSIYRMILKSLNSTTPPIAQPQNNVEECKEGKKMCFSNNRYECINRRWRKIESCQRPAHCQQNDDTKETYCEGGGPCKDGQYTCDDDEIYKCINGKWTLHEKCEDPMECEFPSPSFFDWLIEPEPKCIDAGLMTGDIATGKECERSQNKCESNAVMRCLYGLWEYDEICEDDMKCEVTSDEKAKCVKAKP